MGDNKVTTVNWDKLVLNRKRNIKRNKVNRYRLVAGITILTIFISFLSLYIYPRISRIIRTEIFHRYSTEYLLNMGKGDYCLNDLQEKVDDIDKQLNIVQMTYVWNGELEYDNNPTKLIIHHTASSSISPESIDSEHKEKGWCGIGYHYYIRKDGVIYTGRPENAIGSHAYKNNINTIGICLEGNFENETPSEEQVKSLELLSEKLVIKYNIEEIEGHRDVCETLCPGNNFPLGEIKEQIADNLIKLCNE